MPRKIYDIIPPKVTHKVEKAIRFLDSGYKKKPRHRKTKHPDKAKQFPFREILIGGSIIVVLVAIYFVLKLPKANIEIWPKTEILSIQTKVTADKSVKEVDSYLKVIPANYLEEQQENWQEFEATGTALNEGKASGIINVYNKTDPAAPITLVKGTHFLSDSGKYFITLDRITIPAAKYQKGKLVPGSVSAKVQAKESGSDFNIRPSKFSVPKLSGTSYYYSVWGESEKEMAGGYKGNVKKVTKDDIEKAKDYLEKTLLSEAEGALRNNISEEEVLLENAILRDIVESKALVKSDAIMDKFNVQTKVKVYALVFKKQDLEKFVRDNILSQLKNNQTFLDNSLNINYNPELIDVKSGSQTLSINSSAKTYYQIDESGLVDLLQRKSAGQAESIISQMYGDKISEIKVDFWPFWVKKSPKNKERIKINLNFE